MTAILSWFVQDKNVNPHFMTVGDTKISEKDGERTLTLEGAKILPLDIKCKDLSTPTQRIYSSRPIGFAFAGSTLVALNTYTLLQSVFSNIGGLKELNNLPDFQSLSNVAKRALEFYFKSIRSSCEIILFGFCPKHGLPNISTISFKLENGSVKQIFETINEFKNEVSVVHIGDKKDEFLKEIEKRLGEQVKDTTDYWRIPAFILEEAIIRGDFETIGGNLQIMQVYQNKLMMFSNVRLIDNAKYAEMKFRNIDIFTEVGLEIGECYNAINGLQLKTNL